MQPKKHRAKILGGDLETDNDGETAWIVQSCISDGERRWHDTDVQGIRRTLTKLMWNYGDIVVYYHNLKYDLSFLKPVIAIKITAVHIVFHKHRLGVNRSLKDLRELIAAILPKPVRVFPFYSFVHDCPPSL